MMQVRVRPFLSGNSIDSAAGACIEVSGSEPLRATDPEAVGRWLDTLPSTFLLDQEQLAGSVVVGFGTLLQAISEQARLDSTAQVRALRQASSSWLFWLPIDDPQAAQLAADLALLGIQASQEQPPDPVRSARLWSRFEARAWNQTHRHLALAAARLGVPARLLDCGHQRCLVLGHGAHQRRVLETVTDRTPLMARLATDKAGLHQLLAQRGVPLPHQRLVTTCDQALQAAEAIGWPVVLKPARGGKGRGVWVGLNDQEAVRDAWHKTDGLRDGTAWLLQQHLVGHDHRLLVVNGSLMAAARRQPASLVSDGAGTLADQIARFNQSPDRGKAYERLKNRVPVDGCLEAQLSLQGWTLTSVPPKGERIRLSGAANLSQGGDATDCLESVHPDNRRLAEDVATLIGADVVGLDVISSDLSVSWHNGGTWLLEANLSPGLRPHLLADPSSDLCERLIQTWCGSHPRQSRVPVALVTGSIGKTTTARVLAHLLSHSVGRVGLACSTGLELNADVLMEGDCSGGGAAAHLLTDPRVEVLVAEMARGNLSQRGLGLDAVDGAIVTGVGDNHVGFDGIPTRDAMARLKSKVAEAAQSLVVLNADDPLVLAMAQGRPIQSVAFVSRDPGSEVLNRHRQAKGLVASYDTSADGLIRVQRGDTVLLQMRWSEIPASQGGAVLALAPAAASAALLALGLGGDIATLREAFLTFGHRPAHRAGRFEVLKQHPFELVLTWADGAEAMASVAEYVRRRVQTNPSRRSLLLVSAPDKRSDAYLRAVGASTLGFDQVFCAARSERDARAVEEVPQLLAEGVRSIGSDRPNPLVMADELDAVKPFLKALRPGDLAVVSTFETQAMRQRLHDVGCSLQP